MRVAVPIQSKPVRISLASNAKEFPKEYIANFLEPGLVSYESDGAGIAMLRRSAIEKMMAGFVGQPVIMKKHKRMTPDNFEKHAVGYITRVWMDADGWAWCAFLLTDDEAKELVAKGYSVSCSYDVTATGPGGEWHAIKFDEEIMDGKMNHLAIVDNPRYEDCRIYNNAKGAAVVRPELEDAVRKEKVKTKQQEKTMKLQFKKKVKDNAAGVSVELDPADVILEIGGAPVSLATLMNSKKAKDNAKPLEELDLEDVFVGEDGKDNSISALIEEYEKNNAKPAAAAPAAAPAVETKENAKVCSCAQKDNASAKMEDHAAECSLKANADDDEDEVDEKGNRTGKRVKKGTNKANGHEEGKPKENAKPLGMRHFRLINQAAENAVVPGSEIDPDTRHNRLLRGEERYGSTKKTA